MEVSKEEVNSEEAREARTDLEEEYMDGAEEETNQERKAKRKEDSSERAIIVAMRGAVRGSLPRKGREEVKERAKGKDSKGVATSVDNFSTAQATAFSPERAQGAKEEHMQ